MKLWQNQLKSRTDQKWKHCYYQSQYNCPDIEKVHAINQKL